MKKRRLTSLFVAMAMAVSLFATNSGFLVRTSAAPAFDGFAEGRHTVTVNGLTATVNAWNPDSRTMTVEFSGSATPLAAGSKYIIYARAGTGPNTGDVAPVTSAASTGKGLKQTRDFGPITQFRVVESGSTPAETTLTFPASGGNAEINTVAPWTFDNTNVRLYIGIVSALFVPNADATRGTPVTTNSILTVNGLTMSATYTRISDIVCELSYRLTGNVGQSGNYKVWFTQDSSNWGGSNPTNINTIPDNGVNNAAFGPWATYSQIVNEFSFFSGDRTTATGSWSPSIMRPRPTVVRVEFEPLPQLGGTSTVNNVTASALGALSQDKTTYTVNISLNGTAQSGGYHSVALTGLPAGYTVDNTGAQAVRVEGAAVNRTVRYQIGIPDDKDGSELPKVLGITHDFYPDVQLVSNTESGLTATGVAKLSYEAGLVSVDVKVAGTATMAGTYNVNLTGNGVPADARSFPVSTPGAVNRDLKWSFEYSALDLTPLNLSLGISIAADKVLNATPVNGVTATATAKSGIGNVSITAVLGGMSSATQAGTYRMYVQDKDEKRSDYSNTHLKAGESPKPGNVTLNDSHGLDFDSLTLKLEFFPDFSVSEKGVTATGNIAIYETEAVINVALSGQVERNSIAPGANNGYYRIGIVEASNERYEECDYVYYLLYEGSVVKEGTGFVIRFTGNPDSGVFGEQYFLDSNNNIDNLKLELKWISDSDYAYRVDYWGEQIFLGGNEEVEFGNKALYAFITEKNMTKFLADPSKTKFFPTLNGRIDISKNIPRKGASVYVALRSVGTGQLLTETKDGVEVPILIELKARPDAAASLKAAAKNLYDIHEAKFKNTTNGILEIRLGRDTAAKKGLLVERLGVGQEFAYDYDMFPFGSPGTIRIAAEDLVTTKWENGELVNLTAAEIDAQTPNFASLPTKFKVPAQPKAPNIAKMVVTAGKNGLPNFIKGTNNKMKVKLGNDIEGNAIWSEPLRANTTIIELDSLLATEKYNGQILSGSNYLFELRIFDAKGKRPLSAPGFLKIDKDTYDGNLGSSARIGDVSIGGNVVSEPSALTSAEKSANLFKKGVDFVITVVNDTPLSKSKDNVNSWFKALPEGLTATVKSVKGASITITVKGATTTASSAAIEIVIPADKLRGEKELIVEPNPNAVFDIK